MGKSATSNADREAKRSRLPEALVLAASPAFAYVLAFAYEYGYSVAYGYPAWLIEIRPVNVVMAWAALAVGSFSLFGITVMALSVTPVSLARVAFTRSMFLLVGLFGGAVGSVLLLWDYSPWMATSGLVLMGTGAAFYAVDWYRQYGRTDSSMPRLERLHQAAREMTRRDVEGYEDGVGVSWSLMHRITRFEAVRDLFAYWFLAIIATAILILPVWGLGETNARRQRAFLVATDGSELVALRRYGETLVAGATSPQDQQVIHRIYVLPLTAERGWQRQLIGPLVGMTSCSSDPPGSRPESPFSPCSI